MSLDENHREKLRTEIITLEKEISKLEKTIADKELEKATAIAKMQVRLFLERIFAPYMEGVCSVWDVTPEEGLRILIEENETIDKIATKNPEALAELLKQPEMKIIVTMVAPIGTMSDDWITDRIDLLLEVMRELRPELARGITETPGGMDWFTQSLTGLKKTLFSY